MARRRRARRGVLLLIVLSLLVLFLLVGLSFMVSAGQFNRLARSAAKTNTTGTPGHKLADNVMYQLLRGTHNPYSSLQGHSLLEDLYGRDYLIGTSSGIVDDNTSQQVQRIRFDASAVRLGESANNASPTSAVAAQINQALRDDYYAGCVLTFLDGNAKGKSTRVVTYKPSSQEILIKGVVPVPTAKSTFIINGRPFSGTGAGYNFQSGRLDQGTKNGGPPLAFLPNYSSYQYNSLLGPSYLSGDLSYNIGGMDESYDSVDYQNMFLAKPADQLRFGSAARAAYEIAQGNRPPTSTPEGIATLGLMRFFGNSGGAIPSFHRPYLLAHLQTKMTPAKFANYQKAIMLRPIGGTGGDHPAFTGSNPQFDPVFGPWDVDNDGDGIPESIWVDAGLSPVSGPDGRLYKPLVAIHVVDMDGRLNINAIDGLERSKTDQNLKSAAAVRNVAGLKIEKRDLGLGHGPADISLPPGTQPSMLRSRNAGKIFDGSTGDLIEKNDKSPPSPPTAWEEVAAVGRRRIPGAFSGDDDSLWETRSVKLLQEGKFTNHVSLATGFGSPSDLHGRGLPLLDQQGNIVWTGRWFGVNEGIDDPYEINLFKDSPYDNPYGLNDLVRLLKVDPTNDRITAAKKTQKANSEEINDLRGFFTPNTVNYTTRSFSIPAVSTVGVGRRRGSFDDGEGLPRTVREMFAAKLVRGGVPPVKAFNFVATWDLMAPEFERGEKMDINRVLVPNVKVNFSAAATSIAHPDQQRRVTIEKERFARHLFNLMMLVCDEPEMGVPGLPTPAAQREAHVRRIAQWAINVVDFGDSDSVMTRFRYDVDPFNTEPIRFNPNTGEPRPSTRNSADFREIWGMEHPEMILTETLALHDRRVENTDQDDGDAKLYDGTDEGDADFDSTTKPEGSLFVELLCTRAQEPANPTGWPHATSKGSEDLYIPNSGLDLDAQLPGSGKPVWRLAISEPTDAAGARTPRQFFEEDDRFMLGSNRLRSFEPMDAPSPFWTAGAPDPLDMLNLKLDRFIWFSKSTPSAVDTEEKVSNTYVHSNPGIMPDVRPGDYVLVGPRMTTSIGLNENLEEEDQKIDLQLAPKGEGGARLQRGNALTRAIPVVAQTAITATNTIGAGCSVSEPLATTADYYPDLPVPGPAPDPDAPVKVETYPQPFLDDPLDTEPGAPLADITDGQETNTIEDYRTVFLQRLANPSLPWNNDPAHALYNPYRTIDWMPIDLTVFNSLNGDEEDPDDDMDSQLADLTAPAGNPQRDGARFESLEKTGYPDRENSQVNKMLLLGAISPTTELLINNGYGLFNIWSGWTSPPVRNVGSADGPVRDVDNTTIVHSLGWLNRSFADFLGNAGAGGLNTGQGYYQTGGAYSEAPRPEEHDNVAYTFPSLVWHNRPYANPYELMLVPASSSSRLSADYTTSLAGSPVNHTNPKVEYRGAFGHLLNFFHSTSGTKNESDVASNFYRIFDFVDVPSRFQGTQTWLTRNKIPPNTAFHIDAADPVAQQFNKATILEFRDPGKVNANTFRPDLANLSKKKEQEVAEQVGFNSLIAPRRLLNPNLPDPAYDAWSLFQQSLAGGEAIYKDTHYGTSVNGRFPNGNHPAEYPNPLRAGTSADLKPRLPGTPKPKRPAVEGTLLRSNQTGTGEMPALAPFNAYPPGDTSHGLERSLQNRKTNAYFRFKDLMKLGNSVTSQSNVFAVWVTVGYFEVLPNMNSNYTKVIGVDTGHLDGYQLGIEMGSDIGQVSRHRSFYIIDRSIPVAFQPGSNHNVDSAVLIRRRLE